MERDRLGRIGEVPSKNAELRPLQKSPLPEEWVSKALRVAMSELDWERSSALGRSLRLRDSDSSTSPWACDIKPVEIPPRSHQPDHGPLDWMDWERRKTLRLLLQPDPGPLDWMDWERRKTLRLLWPKGSRES